MPEEQTNSLSSLKTTWMGDLCTDLWSQFYNLDPFCPVAHLAEHDFQTWKKERMDEGNQVFINKCCTRRKHSYLVTNKSITTLAYITGLHFSLIFGNISFISITIGIVNKTNTGNLNNNNNNLDINSKGGGGINSTK